MTLKFVYRKQTNAQNLQNVVKIRYNVDKNIATRKEVGYYGTKGLLAEFPNKHLPLTTYYCEASAAEDR